MPRMSCANLATDHGVGKGRRGNAYVRACDKCFRNACRWGPGPSHPSCKDQTSVVPVYSPGGSYGCITYSISYNSVSYVHVVFNIQVHEAAKSSSSRPRPLTPLLRHGVIEMLGWAL